MMNKYLEMRRKYIKMDCTKDNPGCHTALEMGYGRQELAKAVADA
jgi:hypothetical protein